MSDTLRPDAVDVVRKIEKLQVKSVLLTGDNHQPPTASDIAVEAADIALVSDDIQSLPHLLALSKRTMNTIKLNMALSTALNFIAIILAMAGLLGPVAGALIHNAGSVAVVINSSLLYKMEGRHVKNWGIFNLYLLFRSFERNEAVVVR